MLGQPVRAGDDTEITERGTEVKIDIDEAGGVKTE